MKALSCLDFGIVLYENHGSLGFTAENARMPRTQCQGAVSFETAPCCCGAEYEIRTRDFHLGKVTLYH